MAPMAGEQRAVDTAITANKPMLIEAELDSEEYRRIPGWK